MEVHSSGNYRMILQCKQDAADKIPLVQYLCLLAAVVLEFLFFALEDRVGGIAYMYVERYLAFLAMIFLCLAFLVFLFFSPHLQHVSRPGIEPCHSSNLSCCKDNAQSLICCCTVYHQGTLCFALLFSVLKIAHCFLKKIKSEA